MSEIDLLTMLWIRIEYISLEDNLPRVKVPAPVIT